MGSRTKLVLSFCAVVFAMVLATPASAQQVTLVSKMGAKCLDAEGGRSAAGTRLIGYACSGASNQLFNIQSDGTIRQNGMCVDASGGQGRDGDQIVLWNCNGGANQKWRLDNGRLVGMNGKCIDLKGGSGYWFGNQPAILWSCNGQNNQSWIKGVVVSRSRVQGNVPTVSSGAQSPLSPVNTPANVVAAGGGNVVAAGGGNVVASGGGNVIAAGGGNVIAAGGGNMIVLAK